MTGHGNEAQCIAALEETRCPKAVIWLRVIYTKAVRGNIPAHILKQIKEAP